VTFKYYFIIVAGFRLFIKSKVVCFISNITILNYLDICIIINSWRKNMIACNVCGHLNPVGALICENCGSDLSDSSDYGGFDEDDEFF
jgi:hypothetical protein